MAARFGDKCIGTSAEIRIQNHGNQSAVFITTFAFENNSYAIASPVIIYPHNENELFEHNKFINIVLQALHSDHGRVFGGFCSDCKQPLLSQSYKSLKKQLCDSCLGVRTTSPRKRGSLVYLVRSSLTGLFKIGITENLKRRVRSLENSQGGSIEIISAVPGDRELERSLHDRFEQHRKIGEWFNADNSILEAFTRLEKEGE